MLFFTLRCLIPLMIMLGISYLLRKFGLVQEPPKPPTPPTDTQPTDIGDQPNDPAAHE